MRTELAADCASCAALCCLMLAFDRGPSFAIDKPAGVPCPNLAGHACAIHDRLAMAGFAGCTRYDCLGAGQIVVQRLFGGRSWRDDPALAAPMAEAFRVLRAVQEMRAQLAAARGLGLDAAQEADRAALDARLSPDWTPEAFRDFDLPAARAAFHAFIGGLKATAARFRRRA